MRLWSVSIVLSLLLFASVATAYEFEASGGVVAEWESYGATSGVESWHTGGRDYPYRVTTMVKPDECRLYLTFEDDGRGHQELLQQAKAARDHLGKILGNIGEGATWIEAVNYSPEKSFGGFFSKEKDEIRVGIRVTIRLEAQKEDRFWQNAELVATVLDGISEVKKDGKWGKKLKEGRVAYAVHNIDVTKILLLEQVNEEVKDKRRVYALINGVDASDVICDVEYGDLVTEFQTLQGVKVILPYRVDFRLKKDKQ